MKTSIPPTSPWQQRALQTLHNYTIRGAYPLIIGYPRHPEIILLESHLKPCSVIGSSSDAYQIPGYRAYVAIHHYEYREKIAGQILDTLQSIHPHSIILYRNIIDSNQNTTIAA